MCPDGHAEYKAGCAQCELGKRNPKVAAAWAAAHARGQSLTTPGGQDADKEPGRNPPPPAAGKVGDHLAALLAGLGFVETAGCGCGSMKARMNSWGVHGCRANRAEIEAWLREKAGAVGLLAKAAAGVRALAGGLLVNPLDPAPGFLDVAIRRATPPPAGRYLTIPEPPPIDVEPTSDRVIVTAAVGEDAVRTLAASRPLMEAYARRVGADLVVLDWVGNPDYPMGCKYGAWAALAPGKWKRLLWADADVVFLPRSVDWFAACAADRIGVYDELPFAEHAHRHMVQTYLDSLAPNGFPATAPQHYFNAGLVHVPAACRDFLAPPARLWVVDNGTGWHCAEQHIQNARLWHGGYPFQLMDRRFNHETWIRGGLGDATPESIVHLSGTPRERRPAVIAELAARFPTG